MDTRLGGQQEHGRPLRGKRCARDPPDTGERCYLVTIRGRSSSGSWRANGSRWRLECRPSRQQRGFLGALFWMGPLEAGAR